LSSAPQATRRWLALAWFGIVVVALANVGWVWLVERRPPETDILALLPAPERDPVLQAALKNVSALGQSRVIVLVGDRDWAAARSAADAYRRVIGAHPAWLRVERADSTYQSGALAVWWTHRAGLLTATDRRALEERTSADWADKALGDLASPFTGGSMGTWQDDGFGLFRRWLQARAQETPARPVDGELQVVDSGISYVVITIALAAPSFAIQAQRAIVPVLDTARDAAHAAAPGVRVMTAGVILFAHEAAETAQREMAIIGWGSIAGILLLMWLAFRSPAPILQVVLSLGVGLVGALSVSGLLFARIHLITLVFGASLIGVAQDYGVLYLAHRQGDAGTGAARMRALLPALLFALGTTAVGYLGLALTPFPGLRQMAVFSIAGLFFAWITVVLWFPFLDRRPPRETAAGTWLGRSIEHWPAMPGGVAGRAAIIIGSTALIAAGLLRVRSDDDLRLLVHAAPMLVAEQREVGRIMHVAAPAQFFLVRAPDAETLLQREEALRVPLDSLVASGALAGYRAVSTWVPSHARQSADRALADTRLYRRGGALDMLASRLGEGETWTAGVRRDLAAASGDVTIEAWLASPVSEASRHRWLGRIGDDWSSVIDLEGVNAANVEQLRAIGASGAGARWIDIVAGQSALLGRYRRQMLWVVVVSFVLLWGGVLPRYGRRTWRVLTPTAAGIVFTVAMLGLIGQPVQLMHVLALLLLFGMGVDYGIFLEEARGERRARGWLAVVLAAASALLSFGLLGLSSTPALHFFGTTMLIGISTIALLTPFCSPRAT
jgi:predicted exporter